MSDYRLVFVHAPTDDSRELFRGAPMSILYALAVLCDRVGRGQYPGLRPEQVVLYDAALRYTGASKEALQRFRESLPGWKPAAVGIGTTSHAYYWAIQFAKAVKEFDANCPVIVGGPHEDEHGPSGPGGSIDEYGDLFDFSIQGDAEYVLAELVDVLYRCDFRVSTAKETLACQPDRLQNCPGHARLSFRYEGRTVHLSTTTNFTPGLPFHTAKKLDLRALPLPPRYLLEEEHRFLFDVFRHEDGGLKPTAQVMTHRGCPYTCSFCTERGSYVGRPVESVVAEIAELAKLGYKAVFFDDSTFHLYHGLPELLEELRRRRDQLGLEYGCLTRADRVLRDSRRAPLSAFREAGFTYMYLGLEHYSDKVLAEMKKGFGTATIDGALAELRRAGIRVGVSLLFGFQSETEKSQRQTLELVATDDNIVLANLSLLCLHPAAAGLLPQEQGSIRYDRPAPNAGLPWDFFEEGRWYHPPKVTEDYVWHLLELIWEIDDKHSGRLARKLKRAKELEHAKQLLPGRCPVS
jgi:hypothetical protein